MKTKGLFGIARIFCAVLVIMMVCQSFAFAAIVIDDTEYGINILKLQADDRTADGTTKYHSNATVIADPTDSGMGNVYQTNSNYMGFYGADTMSGLNATFKDFYNNPKVKYIKLKFDYYTAAGARMRTEVRDVYQSKNDVTGSSADFYRLCGKYNDALTQNTWTTYEQIFDLDALREYYGTDSTRNSYLFISALNSGGSTTDMYVDNISIQVYGYIYPLATPDVNYNTGVINPAIEDYKGETGSVYEYTFNVQSNSQTFDAITFKYPTIAVGRYHAEVYFMESSSNALPMTRMVRWTNNAGTEVTGTPERPYYNSKIKTQTLDENTTWGKWRKLYIDFEVAENSTWYANLKQYPTFKFRWTARADDTGYDASQNGTYTVYFSDPVLYKYPAASDNLVEMTSASAEHTEGTAASYGIRGFVDTTVTPVLTLNGIDYTGSYQTPTSTAVAEDGNIETTIQFNTETLTYGTRSGTITVKDLTGAEYTFDVSLATESEGINCETDAYLGSWSENIYVGGDVTVPAGTSYISKRDNNASIFSRRIRDILTEGNGVFLIEFTYQGEAGETYQGTTNFQFRTDNGVEGAFTLNNSKLASGEAQTEKFYVNVTEKDRRYLMNGNIYDRYATVWNLFFRNQASGNTGSITYSNVSVKYIVPDQETPSAIVYKVKAKNNSAEATDFSGYLFAYRQDSTRKRFYGCNIKQWSATGTYNQLLAGETRYYLWVDNTAYSQGTFDGIKNGSNPCEASFVEDLVNFKPLSSSFGSTVNHVVSE